MRSLGKGSLFAAALVAALFTGHAYRASGESVRRDLSPPIGEPVVVQIDPGTRNEGFVTAEGKLAVVNDSWVAVRTDGAKDGMIWFPTNRVTAIKTK